MKRLALACAAIAALVACKPTSVNDAEAKADVGYLTTNGSPEAVAALGRLADKNGKARGAIEVRAESDMSAYIAAWGAVQRGAPWGAALIKSGLSQPARAELAASAMTRSDARLADYVPYFSKALVDAGAKEPRMTVAAMLASTGAGAVVAERLRDNTTRANMCRGLGAPDASGAARKVLVSEPEESRNDPACVDSLVEIAKTDEPTLTWLAERGEPGLMSGASKGDSMACPRLAKLWAHTFERRPAAAYASLAVPLAHAIKRCAVPLDDVLAGAIAKSSATAPLVIAGVDPFGAETSQLAKTCKALPGALRSVTGRTRDRAADTLSNGCKGPRR